MVNRVTLVPYVEGLSGNGASSWSFLGSDVRTTHLHTLLASCLASCCFASCRGRADCPVWWVGGGRVVVRCALLSARGSSGGLVGLRQGGRRHQNGAFFVRKTSRLFLLSCRGNATARWRLSGSELRPPHRDSVAVAAGSGCRGGGGVGETSHHTTCTASCMLILSSRHGYTHALFASTVCRLALHALCTACVVFLTTAFIMAKATPFPSTFCFVPPFTFALERRSTATAAREAYPTGGAVSWSWPLPNRSFRP